MKILFFGNNSFNQHKRGVENVIAFQSKAYDFDRIFYLHWGIRTKAYKYNNFICISLNHCWYWPLVLNLLLLKIKKKNKIIIHSHNPLFSFCSFFRTNILTVHDGVYYYNKSTNNKHLVLFKIIEKLLYRRCDLVHFISNYTKQQSLFGKRKNFIIIPNTSQFETIVPLWPLPKNSLNEKSILVVRSIEERARFDLLLLVAERLQEHGYKFKVAGKGPLLTHYRNEIEKRKILNVQMLGYINDIELIRLYSNCDLVLLLAEYGEGFGLPIIEGYLLNKPVIASRKCAIPEVIFSDDYLFENNVDDIINSIFKIENFVNHSYRSYYNSKFSNAIVLEQFRKLYSLSN